jgi:hypothetical protein
MTGLIIMDGNDFWTTYKVLIEKITGTLSVAKTKSPVLHDWKDDHGEEVYLDKRFYEPREITVKGAIIGSTASDYVSKVNAFQSALLGVGFRRLKFANINKRYLCYTKDGAVIDRITKWTGSAIAGKFTLKFIEPYPMNRQWVNTSASVVAEVTCTKKLNIDWGDGVTTTVYGTSQMKLHTYAGTGYIMTLYGTIENLTSIGVTNLTEITN